MKKFIISNTPKILQKGDASNIRDIFTEEIEDRFGTKNEYIPYNNMIKKINVKTEDELQVLLDNLYFYDKDLFKFKEIFMTTNNEESEKIYHYFGNKVEKEVVWFNNGWRKNLEESKR